MMAFVRRHIAKETVRFTVLMSALFLLLATSFSGCGEESESMFPSEIQNARGMLSGLNKNGFMGVAVAGTSIDYEINLYAAGGLDLTLQAVTLATSDPIAFKGGTYPGTGGTCGSALVSGTRCKIVLIYQPSDTTAHSATLNISYSDALATKSLSFALTADSRPILQFEYGLQYDFGNKFIGTSNDLRIKISNMGVVAAEQLAASTLSAPYSYKGGTYPGTGGTCGSRLDIGANCQIVVNYSPTTSGAFAQTLNLTYLNVSRTETSPLSLTGWGFEPALLIASDAGGVSFGTVAFGETYDYTITLSHISGDVDATVLSMTGLSAPFSFKGGTYPGTGGSCGTTLLKTVGNCTIVLSFSPTASGTWNQTATISYNSGSQTVSFTRSITGTARQKALLSFNPTGTVDFGTLQTGNSTTKTFTVTYVSGELPANNLDLPLLPPFEFVGGSFPGTGGTCSTSLSSGSCTIKVAFSPTTANTYTQNTSISYNDGYSTLSSDPILLSAKTESNVQFASNPFDFGGIVTGHPESKILTINYVGGVQPTLMSISPFGNSFSFTGGTYPGTAGTCTTTMTSSTCDLDITFSPTVDGLFQDTISLQLFDGFQMRSVTVPIMGMSTGPAVLTLENVDFGSQSLYSSTAMRLTVTNSSPRGAAVMGLDTMPTGFKFKDDVFPGTGGTCSTTLNPGESCDLVLLFQPTAEQAYSGTLKISYHDGVALTTSSATLSGNGIKTTRILISYSDTKSFPDTYVGSSNTVSFTIRQGGSATPSASIVKSFSPSGQYSIINDTCPSSLANGASCTFDVVFSPTTTGTHAANLVISYNDGANKTSQRALTGNGLQLNTLAISPSSWDFGTHGIAESFFQSFVVTMSGSSAVTSMTGIITGDAFSYFGGLYPGIGGTCGTTLNVGDSCTIVARFSAPDSIAYSGTIGIQYFNGASMVDTTAALTGAGSPTSKLNFASSTYDYGQAIQTQTVTATFTITHSGPANVTGISAAVLAAPFSYKGGSYPGTGGTCGSSLAVGASCTIVVNFNPTTTGGFSNTLALNYTNEVGSQTAVLTLQGQATTQAIINVSDGNPYNFGTVSTGSSADKTFTLSNAGGVNGTSITFSFELAQFNYKGGTFPGTGGTCTSSLAPSASCSVVVTFSPTAATSYSSLMTLNYNDGIRTQSDVKELRGQGQ